MPRSTTSTALTTTTAPTTTVPDTTTLPPSTTTIDVPLPDATGQDWLHIATELEQFAGWLFENPDPELVSEWAVEGSSAYETLYPLISESFENGWRDLPGGRAEVLNAEFVTGDVESGSAVIEVATHYDGATTVDADGNVVLEEPGRGVATSQWLLAQGSDGRWRVRDIMRVEQ